MLLPWSPWAAFTSQELCGFGSSQGQQWEVDNSACNVVQTCEVLRFILVLNNVIFSTVVPLQSVVDTRNTQILPREKERFPKL